MSSNVSAPKTGTQACWSAQTCRWAPKEMAVHRMRTLGAFVSGFYGSPASLGDLVTAHLYILAHITSLIHAC